MEMMSVSDKNLQINLLTSNQKFEYRNVQPTSFFDFFPKKLEWYEKNDRKIITNLVDCQLPYNRISTSKYNLITFFPKNLLHQFKNYSNIYFLFIGFLQCFTLISDSDGKPVIILPLSFIVIVTMLKDAYEDFQRFQSDRTENLKKVDTLINGKFVKISWQSLRVGHVIRICQDEHIPADIVVIASSDNKNVCFIETKNLDGETNLKNKKAPKEFQHLKQMNEQELFETRLLIDYEKPTPYLYNFTGTISFYIQQENLKIPLDQSNLILRGCSLKNTEYIYGVVCYSGHDTKIMLNSVKAQPKYSKLQIFMNQQIISIFYVQVKNIIYIIYYYQTFINQVYVRYSSEKKLYRFAI